MEYNFEWKQSMSVNNEIIDNQHKKLLHQINLVLKSFIDGDNDTAIQSSLSFFEDYINEHLAYEDSYMTVNNYPKIEEHRLMHKNFIEFYDNFKKKIENNEPKEVIVSGIENYVGNWWIEHIGKADKDYADYIKNKKDA